MRRTYVLRDGKLVLKDEAPPLQAGPFIWSDLPAYRSPVGTGWIEGRAARREDLKRAGCVEAGDMPRLGFRSENYARQAGKEPTAAPRKPYVRTTVIDS